MSAYPRGISHSVSGIDMEEADYALGYAEAELRRLTTQARLIDPITHRFLEAAGLRKGMRVLDIGSGAGDVARLCGEIVGPDGEVVGTDLAQVAVERAAAAHGLRLQLDIVQARRSGGADFR